MRVTITASRPQIDSVRAYFISRITGSTCDQSDTDTCLTVIAKILASAPRPKIRNPKSKIKK